MCALRTDDVGTSTSQSFLRKQLQRGCKSLEVTQQGSRTQPQLAPPRPAPHPRLHAFSAARSGCRINAAILHICSVGPDAPGLRPLAHSFCDGRGLGFLGAPFRQALSAWLTHKPTLLESSWEQQVAVSAAEAPTP